MKYSEKNNQKQGTKSNLFANNITVNLANLRNYFKTIGIYTGIVNLARPDLNT